MVRYLLPVIVATIFGPSTPCLAQIEDTLRVGHPSFAGRQLPLGTETIQSFIVRDGKRKPLNTVIQTIARGRESSKEAYIISSVHITAGTQDSSFGEIMLRSDDFSLLHHKIRAPVDSMAIAYVNGSITGWVVMPKAPVKLLDAKWPHPVLPVDGASPWMLSLLPLHRDYRAIIARFSPLYQKEVWETVRVISTDFLERDGRRIECWKVDTGKLGPPGYIAIRWVEKSSGRILRTLLRGKEGQAKFLSITE